MHNSDGCYEVEEHRISYRLLAIGSSRNDLEDP
jgi:hypothetical protein